MSYAAIGHPISARPSALLARRLADRLFLAAPLLHSIRILACAYEEALQTWFEWRLRDGLLLDPMRISDAAAASAWRFQKNARPLAEIARDEAQRHAAMAAVSAVALTRRGTWLAEHARDLEQPGQVPGSLHPILFTSDTETPPDILDFLAER